MSTTSADTCPDACPLKKGGCYADGGPLAIFWRKVSDGEAGTTWRNFLRSVAALPAGILWRHDQAGDLRGARNKLDADSLAELSAANNGKRGFTYSHYPVIDSPHAAHNRAAIEKANAAGFTVNISANSAAHADRIADSGIQAPIVVVLPKETKGKVMKTPAGRVISICPYTYRDDIACIDCGLCARPNRASMVGFPAHGASSAKASAIAMGV